MAVSGNIFIIHGNDEFLVDEAARHVLQETCPNAEATNCLTTIAGDVGNSEEVEAAMKELMVSIQSFSMFGDQNVTWLRRAQFLPGGKLFKSEAVKTCVERLQETLAAGLGPEQILVISSDKIDSRSRFLKALKGKASFQEHSRSKKRKEAAQQDRDLLAGLMQERGMSAAGMVMETLLAKVGEDHRLLRMEIEKLDVYLGERREVTGDDVDLMVSSSREVPAYEFCGAVAARDLGKAFVLLHRLEAQKASPIGIMAQLMNQFREMAVYRSAIQAGMARLDRRGYFESLNWTDETGQAMAMECLGGRMPAPFRQSLLAGQSMKFSVAELDRLLRMVAEAYHSQFRSSLPSFLQIELLVIRMLSAPSTRRSA